MNRKRLYIVAVAVLTLIALAVPASVLAAPTASPTTKALQTVTFDQAWRPVPNGNCNAPASATSQTTWTWTHKVGDFSNRLLFVYVVASFHNLSGDDVNSVMLNGNAMDFQSFQNPDNIRGYIYSAFNPPVGTDTIQVSLASGYPPSVMYSVSLYNVNQSHVDPADVNYFSLSKGNMASTGFANSNQGIITVTPNYVPGNGVIDFFTIGNFASNCGPSSPGPSGGYRQLVMFQAMNNPNFAGGFYGPSPDGTYTAGSFSTFGQASGLLFDRSGLSNNVTYTMTTTCTNQDGFGPYCPSAILTAITIFPSEFPPGGTGGSQSPPPPTLPNSISFPNVAQLSCAEVSFTDPRGETAVASTVLWVYNFGDGSALAYSPVPTVTHNYVEAGMYAATMTVQDKSGNVQTYLIDVDTTTGGCIIAVLHGVVPPTFIGLFVALLVASYVAGRKHPKWKRKLRVGAGVSLLIAVGVVLL